MNKSKFLKKSLAMLLALMLVLAMIPLSASAAETGYFKDLYVNGKRVEKVGNDLSVSVLGDPTEVAITGAALNGATLYLAGDLEDQKLPVLDVDLTEYEEVGEGEYELTILAKKKLTPNTSDYETVESYTLTITVEELPADNDNTSLRGLAEGDPTWAHMVSYIVEDEQEGAGTVTITMEFGWGAPHYQANAFDAIAPDATVSMDGNRVKVTSAQGSTRLYDVEFVWEAAFESFTIPEQIGETEFVYDGKDGNEININVPYGYDLENVIPTFELVNEDVKLYNDNEQVVTGYTVLDVSNTVTLTMPRTDGDDAEIKLTVTAVAKNPEGVLESIVVTEEGTKNVSNKTLAKEGTFEVEMPKGTKINESTFTLDMVASKNASVTVTDANGSHDIIANADGEYQINGIKPSKGISFSVVVKSEDGTDENNYNVNLIVPTTAQAKLTNVTLKDEKTGDLYSVDVAADQRDIVLTVPYSWTNSANTDEVKVYMTASTGATIEFGGKDDTNRPVWGGASKNGDFYNNLGGAADAAKNWMPKVSLAKTPNVADDTEVATYTVCNNDAEPQYNTYTFKIVTEDPETEREITEAQMVGTDKPYEITESNTYKTELGTATLDGKTVRTIEVTVPYSFEDDGDNSGWFEYMTISDGAVAYYYDLDESDNTGHIETLREISTDPKPNGFVLSRYLNGKNEKGELVKGDDGKVDYLPIYVLSEAYAVPAGATITPDDYDDNDNASIYYLVVKKAAPETGDDLLSIESTLDKNVTATLDGDTVEISAPDTYGSKNQFSLNFEQSKLAKVYAKTYTDDGKVSGQVELTSDLGDARTAGKTMFKMADTNDDLYVYNGNKRISYEGKGMIVVKAEDGNNTRAYDLKVVREKPQTGATISALSVNGIAGTIARDKITVRLPLGTQLYPVSLDITASKMATVLVDGTDPEKNLFDPNKRYDVNDDVKITVISENGATRNTYTLTCVLETDFEDVNTDKWYYDEVMTAANAGWINGDKPGYYNPEGTMTRGAFITIIARILDCDTEATVESLYPDCNETDWFNAAVTFCSKRGIIDGDDKGYFNPNAAITREEMAKILCNALELDELETSANPFEDDAEIAQWAKGYVNAVQAEGIMEGSNGSFNPRDNATRAEGAAVLVRAFA